MIKLFRFTRYRTALLALLLAICWCSTGCSSAGRTAAASSETTSLEPADLVITNARVHTEPGAAALPDTTLIVRAGKIAELRPTRATDARLEALRHIDAAGLTLTAGLWNSHVHLTAPELAGAPQSVISDMLLKRGFTHVVDTGSTLTQTLALRDAIKAGELQGPHIVLANGSFVYTDGTPSYLPGITLPEVGSIDAAAPMVDSVLALGADGIKVFAGSFMTPQHTIHLPAPIIAAVAERAHSRDSFVFAHPTTITGLSNAVRGKVDVIAHTTAPAIEVPEEILQLMRQQNTAIIPTLMLWREEMLKFGAGEKQADFMEYAGVTQLRNLHAAGITVLFGTDVGYMTNYDPAAEYTLMTRAGMNWVELHRSLTIAPAERFGRFADGGSGTVAVGEPASLTLFAGDPAQNIRHLADVAYTIVNGATVYSAGANQVASSETRSR